MCCKTFHVIIETKLSIDMLITLEKSSLKTIKTSQIKIHESTDKKVIFFSRESMNIVYVIYCIIE